MILTQESLAVDEDNLRFGVLIFFRPKIRPKIRPKALYSAPKIRPNMLKHPNSVLIFGPNWQI